MNGPDITSALLMEALPYFPSDQNDPLLEYQVEDLLSGNVATTKFASDGFLDFFALKLCSSNAKQMSKYFQIALGFEEVAFKGLENDSRLVASHVVQNGKVVFEFVSTLETVENDSAEEFPPLRRDGDLTQRCGRTSSKRIKEDAVVDIEAFIKSSILGASSSEKLQSCKSSRVLRKTLNTSSFKSYLEESSKMLGNIFDASETIYDDLMECAMIQRYLKQHGEGVIDISLQVKDVDACFAKAIANGATTVREPKLAYDQQGSIKRATINIPNTDILHTLIQIIDYTGPYLPGYTHPNTPPSAGHSMLKESRNEVRFQCIDHCVENYSWNQMTKQATFYAKIFGFHKFWSVDDTDVSTGESALRSVVMALANGRVKMPINEPAESKKRGQIEEFNHYNGGAGVQHIALRTTDIVKAVVALRARGVEFNTVPCKYYENLKRRLSHDNVRLKEDMSVLEANCILVDYDPQTRQKNSLLCNYILQIFTKPLHDRPTLFLELIQRRHHDGFGKGTFKGLFESIENEQRLRGTLVNQGEPFA